MNYFQELINEICCENDISFELISKEWIIKLNKDGVYKYIAGSKMPLNSETTFLLCRDKYATYEVLKSANIPVVEHRLIYSTKNDNNFISDLSSTEDFQEYLNKYNKLIIKNTCGSMGEDVYMAKDMNKLKSSLRKVFEKNETAVISPFMNIEAEYRVICLDDEVELIFEKIRNENSWKHNLCQGARAQIVENETRKEQLKDFALRVMRVLNARFASVDLILVDGKLMVLEVNSSVCMSYFAMQVEGGREIAKRIYEKAIKKMYE